MTRKEVECENVFRQMKQVYNANTPENHPLLFKTEQDYKSAMSILGVSAKLHPEVTIYTFQIMSNHIHLVIGGDVAMIHEFFSYFVDRLSKYFQGEVDLSAFILKLFPIQDLSYMRNAVVYVNRNGSVVNNDVTPFSYPWGSNRYFFHPLAKRYDELFGKSIGLDAVRALMHSRKCDSLKVMKMVDGYISPLEFCDVKTAEMIFRDAKQYFYFISRKVEAYSEVAKSIGEAIFFNDNDLYTAAVKLSAKLYDSTNLRTLTADEKLELAKRMHYDYNASDKQIQRLLNISPHLLKALF